MPREIITLEDLNQFKEELIKEIKELLDQSPSRSRKWLKSHQVREMLGISPGTLQNMRINGTIAFTKIKGLIFYDSDDIAKLMDGRKKQRN